MNLSAQRKRVFDYIKSHPNTTIREIRNTLNIMKPCMRISEINQLWREENGIPNSTKEGIIITSGRNHSREALKAIAIQ